MYDSEQHERHNALVPLEEHPFQSLLCVDMVIPTRCELPLANSQAEPDLRAHGHAAALLFRPNSLYEASSPLAAGQLWWVRLDRLRSLHSFFSLYRSRNKIAPWSPLF